VFFNIPQRLPEEALRLPLEIGAAGRIFRHGSARAALFIEFDSIQRTFRRLYMKIRPLHDRVIVKRVEEERKTASGIVIPDTAAEKPDQGEIVAIGAGKVTEDGKVVPLQVKVGDRVLFGKYSGTTVKVKGEELLVMREDDIMGVLEAA
jgi:chaperonin GroES